MIVNLSDQVPVPHVSPVQCSKTLWVLDHHYCITSMQWRIEISAGFQFDGASVPRALWWYCPPMFGMTLAGALVHDALYASKRIERFEADAVFQDILRRSGNRNGKPKIMHAAVRAFGWWPWMRYTFDQVKAARYKVHVK